MHFTKMQGLGNDYLYFYGEVPENVGELSKKLSDRHFGAGSDGLIYISPSEKADFKMRIFNADGSEAKMCGNGIRCVGKYVYDKGYTDRKQLRIETLSGIRTLYLTARSGKVKAVSVEMGRAEAGEEKEILVDGQKITGTPISVGNPHFVILTEESGGSLTPEREGPLIEKHPAFPGGVNVEFVRITGENRLRMRVWERGSGVTMACGTGASASAAAAVRKGYFRPDTPILVELDGGALEITVRKNGEVLMSGSAEFVYEGEAAL